MISRNYSRAVPVITAQLEKGMGQMPARSPPRPLRLTAGADR